MAKEDSPIRVGSKVRVTNHGVGKVRGFAGDAHQVLFVELEDGGEVTANRNVVKRVEAED